MSRGTSTFVRATDISQTIDSQNTTSGCSISLLQSRRRALIAFEFQDHSFDMAVTLV